MGAARVTVVAVLLVALASACDPDLAAPIPPPSPDTIHVGILGPMSGPTAFLGIDFANAGRLAIHEINEAGGVNGKRLEAVLRDSRTDQADAAATSIASVNQLAELDVVAIVGPDASSIVLAVKDTVIARRVPLISPTATADAVAALEDDDLIWRTAANDTLQSGVLAGLVHADGHATVAVIHRDDVYGNGLAQAFATEFTRAGGRMMASVSYPETQTASFDGEVAELLAAGTPDAIVIIGFIVDTAGVLRALQSRLPDGHPDLYGVDGNHDPTLLRNAPPDMVVGMRFTAPVSRGDHNYVTFRDAYRTTLGEEPYRVEFTYDAVYLVALALLQAGTVDAEAVRTHLRGVSRADTANPVRVGVGVEELENAAAHAGEDLDFQGASGLIDFDDRGGVSNATFAIEDVVRNGETLEFQEIDRVEVP